MPMRRLRRCIWGTASSDTASSRWRAIRQTSVACPLYLTGSPPATMYMSLIVSTCRRNRHCLHHHAPLQSTVLHRHTGPVCCLSIWGSEWVEYSNSQLYSNTKWNLQGRREIRQATSAQIHRGKTQHGQLWTPHIRFYLFTYNNQAKFGMSQYGDARVSSAVSGPAPLRWWLLSCCRG